MLAAKSTAPSPARPAAAIALPARDRDCDSSLTDIQIVEESEDEVSSCDEASLRRSPARRLRLHAPAPAPPTVIPAPPQPELATPAKRRLQRSDSVTTFHGGGSESIFRLLPRETRPALRRMLFVEPASRCTLTDLLKGRGKTSGLLCGCPRRRSALRARAACFAAALGRGDRR